MEAVFDEYLGDLINLTELKMVAGSNKKVISSCIFIPELPNMSSKTPNYFTGLIKSIETFRHSMPIGWIYRLYVDELFIDGLKPMDGLNTMESAYNNLSNNLSNLFPLPPSLKKPPSYRKKVKKAIKINLDNLKKVQKLVYLYLQGIIIDSDKYKNVELISFKCDTIKFTGKYPGHANTFGSIIRFFPIFDSNVDLFVSVNSRYNINPLNEKIILDWESRPDKQILTYNYDTGKGGFITNCLENSILPHFHDCKLSATSSVLPYTINEKDKLFTEILNDILKLKNTIYGNGLENKLTLDDLEIQTGTLNDLDKIISYGENNDKDYSNSIGAGFFGIKKNTMFDERINIFSKLLRFLIIYKDNFLFGIDEILIKLTLGVESGTMNLIPEFPNHTIYFLEKEKHFKSLPREEIIKYLGENKVDITKFEGFKHKFKEQNFKKLGFTLLEAREIKELLLKIGYKKIDYVYNLSNDVYSFFGIEVLLKDNDSYITNLNDEELLIRYKFDESIRILDTKIPFISPKIFDINLIESRSLLKKKIPLELEHIKEKEEIQEEHIKEKEEIKMLYLTFNDDLQSLDFSMSYFFSNYSEFKKLFLFDSTQTSLFLTKLFSFKDIPNYFTILDLKDFTLERINELLEIIITHYNTDFIKYKLEKFKIETESNSNSNSNGPGKYKKYKYKKYNKYKTKKYNKSNKYNKYKKTKKTKKTKKYNKSKKTKKTKKTKKSTSKRTTYKRNKKVIKK